jgi:3-oxoacyl-[acyl-carrier protein] reductase
VDLELHGKRVLITGASEGIGLATAQLFAEEGADVALCARRPDVLAKECTAISETTGRVAAPICANLTDPDVFDAIASESVSALGGLDILVNNAGASSFGGFDTIADEQWVADVNLKLFGYVRMTRAALPYLFESASARIVNVAGNAGKQPLDYHMPGAAANAAILNFTKSLSLQIGKRGVMVNSVCPGPVRTARLVKQFQQNAKDWSVSAEEAERRFVEGLPLPWVPTPRDIAGTIVFLASPRAAYLNGTSITPDGGITRGI